jgi:hypothetical protein
VVGQCLDFDGKRIIDLGDVGRFEKNDAFSIGAWVRPTDATDAAIIARMDEKKNSTGYNLYWQRGLIHFQLMNKVPENMMTLVSAAPVAANQWHHVLATWDGQRQGGRREGVSRRQAAGDDRRDGHADEVDFDGARAASNRRALRRFEIRREDRRRPRLQTRTMAAD